MAQIKDLESLVSVDVGDGKLTDNVLIFGLDTQFFQVLRHVEEIIFVQHSMDPPELGGVDLTRREINNDTKQACQCRAFIVKGGFGKTR